MSGIRIGMTANNFRSLGYVLNDAIPGHTTLCFNASLGEDVTRSMQLDHCHEAHAGFTWTWKMTEEEIEAERRDRVGPPTCFLCGHPCVPHPFGWTCERNHSGLIG